MGETDQVTNDPVELIRLDERQKYTIQQVEELAARVQDLHNTLDGFQARLMDCQSTCDTCDAREAFQEHISKINDFEQRLHNLEYLATQQADRWETITRYVFQAIWIVLLTWALTKLNLTPPPFS